MPQSEVWEREYKNPKLLTKKAEPQTDVKNFLKFLRKQQGVEIEGQSALDLGSGTGRNGNYLGRLGAVVKGIELSPTAVSLARERADGKDWPVDYQVGNFGTTLPFADHSFDIILDVMSSNSLNESERRIYLMETNRVLKKNGYFFVKSLCKDGDKNAKNLLLKFPGAESDTYINTDMDLVERVFSETDLRVMYGNFFKILRLMKKTNYVRFRGQSYKRNYWLLYLQNN
ncbi:MAG TPA: class I SAM-dependent methyltransferase [bacterium]|nr:class I SAM-dependent methyltransferase [bacterium]